MSFDSPTPNTQDPGPNSHCQEKERSLDLQRAEVTNTASSAPLPMNAIWRTIRGYILWQYERGTLHYDIMVTLIIIFVLFSPRVINFNDKPIGRNPHPTEVLVTTDASTGSRPARFHPATTKWFEISCCASLNPSRVRSRL